MENLKPSDKGEMLMKAVEEKIGRLPVGCELMSGTKKVWLTVKLCLLTAAIILHTIIISYKSFLFFLLRVRSRS